MCVVRSWNTRPAHSAVASRCGGGHELGRDRAAVGREPGRHGEAGGAGEVAEHRRARLRGVERELLAVDEDGALGQPGRGGRAGRHHEQVGAGEHGVELALQLDPELQRAQVVDGRGDDPLADPPHDDRVVAVPAVGVDAVQRRRLGEHDLVADRQGLGRRRDLARHDLGAGRDEHVDEVRDPGAHGGVAELGERAPGHGDPQAGEVAAVRDLERRQRPAARVGAVGPAQHREQPLRVAGAPGDRADRLGGPRQREDPGARDRARGGLEPGEPAPRRRQAHRPADVRAERARDGARGDRGRRPGRRPARPALAVPRVAHGAEARRVRAADGELGGRVLADRDGPGVLEAPDDGRRRRRGLVAVAPRAGRGRHARHVDDVLDPERHALQRPRGRRRPSGARTRPAAARARSSRTPDRAVQRRVRRGEPRECVVHHIDRRRDCRRRTPRAIR